MLRFFAAILVGSLVLVGDCSASQYLRRNTAFPVIPEFRRADGTVTAEPLDLAVISGNIGQPDGTHFEFSPDHQHQLFSQFSGVQHPFASPFFNNAFMNHFGLGTLGLGNFGSIKTPWWKLANVCVERQEDIDGSPVAAGKASVSHNIQFGLHVSINTCIEKPHKHVCTTINEENGGKKKLSITYQCCHGFARASNDVYAPCEKVELPTLEDAAARQHAGQFIKRSQKSGINFADMTNVTLFVPLDTYFVDSTADIIESNLIDQPAAGVPAISENTALSHVIDEWINIEDIENEQLLVSEFDNITIRMNVFPRPPNDDSYEYQYRYTANCVPLVKVNQVAQNGIVHVVDRMLTPVLENIWDLIEDRSDMEIFKAVLRNNKLDVTLREESNKYLTIFAPNDKAFEKMDPNVRRSIEEGSGCAMNILKNHMLEMTFCSAAVAEGTKTSAINSLGIAMLFQRVDNETTSSSRETENDSDGDLLINGEAKVEFSDLMATNGVLHIIDTVLTTESGVPFSSMLDNHNLTVLKQLIDASGIKMELDALTNVTFFAPTNKALEDTVWKQTLDQHPEELVENHDLQQFLKYHVAKPLTKTCDLSEGVLNTEAGSGLRVNLYSTHSVFNNVVNRATVNCARLVHFDHDSCSSVVHQIDRILTPPNRTLLESLEANENYSHFLQLVRAANMTAVLNDPTQNLTLLVPKNDLFAEVQDWFDGLMTHHNQLVKFVKVHILDDVLCCSGIVQSEWPFVRLVTTLNGHELKLSRDRRPKIQNAGITKCDIIARNGLILEVNEFISLKKNKPEENLFDSITDFDRLTA